MMPYGLYTRHNNKGEQIKQAMIVRTKYNTTDQ